MSATTATSRISIDAIRRHLVPTTMWQPLHVFDQVPSTGRRVEARGRHGSFDGGALGVNDKGQMLVQPLSGAPRAIVDEEIRVLD